MQAGSHASSRGKGGEISAKSCLPSVYSPWAGDGFSTGTGAEQNKHGTRSTYPASAQPQAAVRSLLRRQGR
ncbi:hypothetical protein EYF80_026798 [Liparis tanakae]|uniref:Uncharacterized protein n=1 Tax=Liparis tanakae TaxID=230148 RepID=A0A4Z2HAZ8_9TELE|nr:hypothetical protein EYF80_026798 [Liparis tanakae]